MSDVPRVLVTGATGFVGRQVVEALRELWPEAEVVAHGRRSLLAPGSLTDPAVARNLVSRARPTHVVHACGGGPAARPAELEALHGTTTENLLRAVAESGRPVRWLNVGSSAVYAPQDAAREAPLGEGEPDRPVTDYARSKLLQEGLVRAAARTGAVEPVFVRLFNTIGPGQEGPFLVPALVAQLLDPDAAAIRLGNLAAARDFVDVRDAAEAIVALLRCPIAAGERVNVCSGEATTVRRLAALFLSVSERELPLLETSMRPPALLFQRGSRHKAQALCGWRPRRTLVETVRDTWEAALEAFVGRP